MDEMSVRGEAGKLPLIEQPMMLFRLSETHMADPQFPCQLSVGSGSILLQNSHHGDPVYHRRHLTETYLASDIHQHRSLRDEVGHAAAETYLITSLTFMLLRYLGVGYRWVLNFAALYFYACFLMPGFIQVGWYYFFSNCVHRSIVYGGEARNRLDLYLPNGMEEELRPVVIFVTGGAWIIGYKAWGSLIGKQLVERGVIVACLDYRNFPQGTISDMVSDVSQGISYVLSKLTYLNGDPSRVFLVGQSAGSHIAACVLLEQAKKEYVDNVSKLTWRTSQLKAFFGISGGYNLLQLVDHFHQRGLYRSIFLSIMEGKESLPRYSPEIVVKSPSFDNAASFLPPIHLFHGMADYSIPYDASTSFAQTLSSRGIQVKTKLYPNKTHTDIFIQDPMRGGHDELLADILTLVCDEDGDANTHVQVPPLKRLVPEILIQLARAVSPF